jgi:hypothetical protein
MRGDGRWYALSCKKKRPAACRRADGSWFVTGPAVTARTAADACAADGGTFDVPRTGYENEALRSVAGGKRTLLGI